MGFGKAVVLWVAGLVTLVPYGTYYLFAEASRDQYALVATGVLFWIFGYWGVVGPLLAALETRAVVRAIENARSRDDLVGALRSAETREAAIDLIASDNGLPRFLAARVYGLLVRTIATRVADAELGTPRADAAASGTRRPS